MHHLASSVRSINAVIKANTDWCSGLSGFQTMVLYKGCQIIQNLDITLFKQKKTCPHKNVNVEAVWLKTYTRIQISVSLISELLHAEVMQFLYCSWMLAGASSLNPVVHRNELQACLDMQAAPSCPVVLFTSLGGEKL